MAAHKRVVETDLFGTMNGTAAVLPHFRRQERGILINNISLGGFAPVPFAAAYAASKFGLRGFTAGLRQELADAPGIAVCAIYPAVVDSPGLLHGANYSGRALSPGAPVYTPEDVAEAMVGLAFEPRDEVIVGWPSRAARLGYAVAPGTTERLLGFMFRQYPKRARPAPETAGNLFQPVESGTSVRGGFGSGPALLQGGGLAPRGSARRCCSSCCADAGDEANALSRVFMVELACPRRRQKVPAMQPLAGRSPMRAGSSQARVSYPEKSWS